MKASNKASDKQVQYLVLTVSSEGKICASGTHNLSTALINDANLFEQLSSSMRANYSQVHVFHANTHQLNYFTIFIRMEVHPRKNVEDFGYGHHGSKYGQGEPPKGWPEDIDWRGFEGATPLAEITSIMVSLLEAVGLDPNTHIESNENVEENQNNDDEESLMEMV